VSLVSQGQTDEAHELKGIPAKPTRHEGKILIFSSGRDGGLGDSATWDGSSPAHTALWRIAKLRAEEAGVL
jgi:hypothetical protein